MKEQEPSGFDKMVEERDQAAETGKLAKSRETGSPDAAECGVLILAGGLSTRMGRVKWLLELNGRSVLENALKRYASWASEVRVVMADAETAEDHARRFSTSAGRNVRFIHDDSPGLGPLGGLAAGLKAPGGIVSGAPLDRVDADMRSLADSSAMTAKPGDVRIHHVLVAAADLPFPSLALADRLLDAALETGRSAVIPAFEGRPHPLFAVYRCDVRDSLTRYLADGGRKVMEWVGRLDPLIVSQEEVLQADPIGLALFNMNTPEDYESAKRIAATEAAIPLAERRPSQP